MFYAYLKNIKGHHYFKTKLFDLVLYLDMTTVSKAVQQN